MNKVWSFEFNATTPTQLDILMCAFQTLERHKLIVDTELENFLFDPDKGFTIIDFTTTKWHLRERGSDEERSRAERTARNFARSIFTGVGEHDVGGRMSEMREFADNYVVAYERAFGPEAAGVLRDMMASMRREAAEKENRRRGY